MNESIRQLQTLGQSIWYDNIHRGLIESGELAEMIERDEIRGVTSNPTIFQSAINESNFYDTALISMAWAGFSGQQILDTLTIEDIRAAADLFSAIYKETQGIDGYVSLEVNPNLAHDAQATISEVQRLWSLVDRPNLMVKIPATEQGLPAISECIAEGININVTLIFSVDRYIEVIDAYFSGLKRRLEAGKPIDKIASVASFFVSRVDTKVDKRLVSIVQEEGPNACLAARLIGRAAVANAKVAYDHFQKSISGTEFAHLQDNGALPQRPLWASTGTKNPDYSDVKYVEELIGLNTVNTVPHITLVAFRNHGRSQITISDNYFEAEQVFSSLEELGISIQQVTNELEREGVNAFKNSYNDLFDAINSRLTQASRQLGDLQGSVSKRIKQLDQSSIVSRLYDQDASLWADDPQAQREIIESLGWLELPEKSTYLVQDFIDIYQQSVEQGYQSVILVGMGGSSLAAEVISQMISPSYIAETDEPITLKVIDSTDPVEIQLVNAFKKDGKCLYLISSKSGETPEVNALFNYFWHKEYLSPNESSLDNGNHGDHFIAITDPGTPLETLAQEHGFRRIIQADPKIGGRYSALSAFGLIPAVLIGIDIERLLDGARGMLKQCRPSEIFPTDLGPASGRNPGLVLGAILGEAALAGLNKLTFIADNANKYFGAWVEQLIAESTGKDGKGLVPVDYETLLDAKSYHNDRLFVYFRQNGGYDSAVDLLVESGHPVVCIEMDDGFDLGSEFYRWQVATAIACNILQVNAFDQPDVQDTKKRTQQKLDQIDKPRDIGKYLRIIWENEAISLYGEPIPEIDSSMSLKEIFNSFLSQQQPGDYLAINAFLPRVDDVHIWLKHLRDWVRAQTSLATVLGFGPRYLHSTGQLHKGGPKYGLFLFITANSKEDIEIPGEGLTFGTLELAQALGDYEALAARGKPSIYIHLKDHSSLKILVEALY